MRRSTCFALPFVLLAVTGCSGHSEATAPPASVFIRKRDLAKEVEVAAEQAGVKFLECNRGSSLNAHGDGKSARDMTVHFVAKPEQAERLLRALHAEILSRARRVGALCEDQVLASNGPAHDWTIAYVDGHQAGTIKVTCAAEATTNGQRAYHITLDWIEGPKQVGAHVGH